MNSTVEQNYWSAAALSFKWQVKTREVQVIGSVGEPAITEIPLGFQPFGISARGDMVLITDYFAPAVCLNRVTVDGGVLKFEVTWIHGALNGITRCRGGFPDMAYPTGANRCCTAFFAPDGKSVCIGRLDREFFVLAPEDNAQWRIAARVSLPASPEYPFVHSCSLNKHCNVLSTVESNASMDRWYNPSYVWESGNDWITRSPQFRQQTLAWDVQPFHYGVDYSLRGESTLGHPVLVASSHSVRGENATSPGIFVGGKLAVPGIIGSGICVLPNGGALIAAYGQEEEGAHKGVSGKLIYVPPTLLK